MSIIDLHSRKVPNWRMTMPILSITKIYRSISEEAKIVVTRYTEMMEKSTGS